MNASSVWSVKKQLHTVYTSSINTQVDLSKKMSIYMKFETSQRILAFPSVVVLRLFRDEWCTHLVQLLAYQRGGKPGYGRYRHALRWHRRVERRRWCRRCRVWVTVLSRPRGPPLKSYGIVYGQTRTRMDPYQRRVGVVPGRQAGDGGGVSDAGAKIESMDHIL